MKYNPNTVTQQQLGVLQAPYLGGEWNVFLSHVAAVRLGTLALSAASTGVYTDAVATALPAAGRDVQAVLRSPVTSTAALAAVFACKDDTAAGTKTFTADDATEVLTLATAADASWITGTVCRVSNEGGGLPTGLQAGTDYFLIKTGSATYKLAASLADALSGTAIGLSSAGTGTHTLTVAANQTITGTATFSPPGYSSDQSFNFQRGYAVDVVPSCTGKKLTEITSLTSVTNGGANQIIDLYYLPESVDYFSAGCMTGVEFNTKERQPVSIDCQMEASAFTKAGKTKKGELSGRFKFVGFADGVSRFLGHRGTLLLEGVKDGQVTGDRVVFTEALLGSRHNIPDGEGEHVIEVTGEYVETLQFPAPYSAV